MRHRWCARSDTAYLRLVRFAILRDFDFVVLEAAAGFAAGFSDDAGLSDAGFLVFADLLSLANLAIMPTMAEAADANASFLRSDIDRHLVRGVCQDATD